MTDTANLNLPLIAAAQAQKHVTHNEALAAIDALLQCAVLDKDLAAPPAAPAEGARYIVAAAATGGWAGQAGRIAAWQDGAWRFYAQKPGFIAFVTDESLLYVYATSGWVPLTAAAGAIQNLALLGIGTTADAANPVSAKLNKALWAAKTVAEGGTGDLRYTLSKEAAGKTLSLLLQDNFSGRAEIGLTGDDNLHVKVSADGAAWKEALGIDGGTGKVSHAFGLTADTITVRGVPPTSGVVNVVSPVGGVALAVSDNVNASLYLRPRAGGGIIGIDGGNILHLASGTDTADRKLSVSAGGVYPTADNAYPFGSAANRWTAIFAASGAVSTSDARQKQPRGPLSEAELRAWARVRPLVYRWRHATAAKGEGARLHAGWIAQQVADAFAAEGLDPAGYGLWCRDLVSRMVRTTRTAERPRQEIGTEDAVEIAIEDGRAVERIVTRQVQRPATRRLPLYDAEGNRRTRLVEAEDGTTVTQDIWHEAPIMESIEEEHEEPGPEAEQLGLRYEECLVFETAYLRSILGRLESRVAALEALRA